MPMNLEEKKSKTLSLFLFFFFFSEMHRFTNRIESNEMKSPILGEFFFRFENSIDLGKARSRKRKSRRGGGLILSARHVVTL